MGAKLYKFLSTCRMKSDDSSFFIIKLTKFPRQFNVLYSDCIPSTKYLGTFTGLCKLGPKTTYLNQLNSGRFRKILIGTVVTIAFSILIYII